MWESPGFIDHHTHLLRVAAGDAPPYDLTDPSAISSFHRSVATRGLTPMDVVAPPPDQPDLAGALFSGIRHAADAGLVQITEAGVTDGVYVEALQRLRERGDLPLRVRLFLASGIADPRSMVRIGDEALEVEGVKFYADGWLGPRTCAMSAPFADVDDRGVLFLDAVTLARRAEPFASKGWTIATHAIGDRAIEAVLDAYEYVYGEDCAAAAPRIEHAQVLTADLIARMAHLGVVACIQPLFAHSDQETARSALGQDRMDWAYRWDLLLDAGVRVITGSDHPIETLSPVEGLFHLADQVGLDQALALMTDAAAGTTVLSADPHEADMGDVQVVETRCAGL